MKLYYLLTLALLNPVVTIAGTSMGDISKIFVHEPGVLLFRAGSVDNPAPCNRESEWAISLNDPLGKPVLAMLLSAQAQGKKVFVAGYSQTCRDWWDRELPSYVRIIE
jgi:hypothetical protein